MRKKHTFANSLEEINMLQILKNELPLEYAEYCTAIYFCYGIDALLDELTFADVSIAVWDSVIDFDDELTRGF